MRKRTLAVWLICFIVCLAACTSDKEAETSGSLSALEELAEPIAEESTELSEDAGATGGADTTAGKASMDGGETSDGDGFEGKNSTDGGIGTDGKDAADGKTAEGSEGSEDAVKHEEIDYLVLVNSKNKLPDGWEEKLDLVSVENSVGDIVQVERTAYNAYLELKADLMESEGIDLDLDSAYRSVAYQQDILERFTEKYGAAYAAKTVAKPGYSEHHTGLALDLYFRLDGVEVYENEDLVLYPEVWKKIHSRLTKYGFILRYPGRTDGTVDYTYEPWHIRYVGIENAEVISATPGMTLEDYLGKK